MAGTEEGMTDNMIERVAWAMAVEAQMPEAVRLEHWPQILRSARAAIEAMREPTQQMIEDGGEWYGSEECWGLMIKSALSEQ